jgi:hypothetical protein
VSASLIRTGSRSKAPCSFPSRKLPTRQALRPNPQHQTLRSVQRSLSCPREGGREGGRDGGRDGQEERKAGACALRSSGV